MTEPDSLAPGTTGQKSYSSGLFARQEVDTSTPIARRIIGVVLLLIGVLVLATYIWTSLSGEKVFLKSHFGALPSGVFVLLVFVLLGYIAAFPVKTSAAQRRRSRVRTTIIVVMCVSGIVAVFFHALGVFKYQPMIVATSPSGARQAALIDGYDGLTVRIFVGTGLSKREVGNVGKVCGLIATEKITFGSDDSLNVSTPYNDYVIPLDPSTGAPLKHFGPTCTSPAQ